MMVPLKRSAWLALGMIGLAGFAWPQAQALPEAFGQGQLACFFFDSQSPSGKLIESVLTLRAFEFRAHLDEAWNVALIVPRSIASQDPHLALEVDSPAGESLTKITDAHFRRLFYQDYLVAIPDLHLTFREGDPFGDYQVHARIRSRTNHKASYSGIGYLQLGL